MDRAFNRLIESQIQKAQQKGGLRGLEGEGKPLPDHPEEAYMDPGEAVGHRMMAAAGVLPNEVHLKKALEAARKEVAQASEEDKKTAMAKLADLEMRHAIAREARLKVMRE